jgi:hypothetical protein
MASSTPRWKSAVSRTAAVGLLALLLGGCLGTTPERASITAVVLVQHADGAELELTQQLKLSPTMLNALASGIPLRLVYKIDACQAAGQATVFELRYVALTRSYELRRNNEAAVRRFARQAALLAALDRVRLPLAAAPDPACSGRVSMALDLTSLPTPLRFPAFLQPGEWRLVSPSVGWPAARG